MRYILPLALFVSAQLLCAPALAAQKSDQAKAVPAKSDPGREPEKPMNDRDLSAGDVASTPFTDLNLKKGEISQLLIEAQVHPYELTGLRSCPQIAAAVGELDAVLGEDIDTANARKGELKAGTVAQAAVGAFIPFRGLIRELSGANGQEKKVQAAIYAGSVRRAYLKGVGEVRGCRYPARPATPKDVIAMQAVKDGVAQPEEAAPRKKVRRHRRR